MVVEEVCGAIISPGPQYKNVKTKTYVQNQEFFGKKFLIKDELTPLDWKMGTETKQIGKYTCFKATAMKPSTEINWGRNRRNNDTDANKKEDSTDSEGHTSVKDTTEKEDEVQMIEIVAWYTPMIPVNHGPSEYWGLPGLILEVSAGNTICYVLKL